MPKRVKLADPKKPLRTPLGDVPEDYAVKELVLHGDEVVEIPDPVPDRIAQLIASKRIVEVDQEPQPNLLGANGEDGTEPMPQPAWRDPSNPAHTKLREGLALQGKNPDQRTTRDITSERTGNTATFPRRRPAVYVSRDGRRASDEPFDNEEALINTNIPQVDPAAPDEARKAHEATGSTQSGGINTGSPAK
jgi:hypothetical protein